MAGSRASARGVHRQNRAKQHAGPARAEGDAGLGEQSHERAHVGGHTLRQLERDRRQARPRAREHVRPGTARRPGIDAASSSALMIGELLGFAQPRPARASRRRRRNDRPARRRVARSRGSRCRRRRSKAGSSPPSGSAALRAARPCTFRSWMIGKELVLDVGPAAADLVEDDRARAPDGGRRLHVLQAARPCPAAESRRDRRS